MKGFVRKLMALVSGSGKEVNHSELEVRSPRMKKTGGNGQKLAHPFFRKAPDGVEKKEAEVPRANMKGAKPVQPIPRGEGDFKEF